MEVQRKEKVSLTLDAQVARRARKSAGQGHFSEWMNEAALLKLQAERLQTYMKERGLKISPKVIAEVEAEWPHRA